MPPVLLSHGIMTGFCFIYVGNSSMYLGGDEMNEKTQCLPESQPDEVERAETVPRSPAL